MAEPPVSEAETAETPGGEGTTWQIGPFRILRLIGEGGFGAVYEADQQQPVRRRVALKLIKQGMDTQQVIARFEAERQALAMMDHPHIARVLDAGATNTGRPYFVMELSAGDPIAAFCDKHKLAVVDRVKLFGQVCAAVQHAHTKGVIHRDLKPSNVLVSTQDDQPFAKVIDFGIAKATSSRLTDKTLFTEQQQMIGTPIYMSPEQAEGSADIDTRTDVYSLGVMLYELLAGTTPFAWEQLKLKSLVEIQRMIREEEPPRPSVRLSLSAASLADAASKRRAEPGSLAGLVRGDLDWIVMKAIEKERARRYETANALAMDLRRYLTGEPVLAAPPSTTYRLRKTVRRHKGTFAAGLVVVVALLAGIVAFAWQARIARTRADELEQVARFQADMLKQVDPTRAGTLLSDDVRRQLDGALAKAGVAEAERARQLALFAESWRRVNATDAARELIDSTILKPAVDAIDAQFKDQPTVDAALRQVLATRYRDLGLYAAAQPLQERALATRRRVLGNRHAGTLESVSEMGSLLRAQGKLDEAEPLLREALEVCRQVLGPDHPASIASVSNMGFLRSTQGRSSDAEAFHREAVEKRRRVLGPEHRETLESISDLAAVLQAQGRLAEAEPYYREALEKLRRTRGEDDLITLRAIGDMGVLLQTQGRLGEAEPLYREVLEKRRRTVGEEHPHTLIAISNMGFLLQSAGKLSESEQYYREAVAKTKRVLGPDHYTTLTSINNLGRLLVAQGRFAEAVAVLAPSEAAARKASAEGNVRRLGLLLRDLGKARAGLSSFAAAEANLLEAHDLLVKSRGDSHAETRDCAEAVVALYSAREKVSPGEGYAAKAATWQSGAPKTQ